MAVTEWTTVARTGELGEGEMSGGSVAGDEVLVVNIGGQYRAVGATCTHAGCSLVDDGELEGDTVMCGCHGSIFNLHTGEAVGPPADESVPVYEVRVDGDEIQVAAPSG
jgi:3-phenylpropionate/trans-cinnamate dioxygenase ferredoxin component